MDTIHEITLSRENFPTLIEIAKEKKWSSLLMIMQKAKKITRLSVIENLFTEPAVPVKVVITFDKNYSIGVKLGVLWDVKDSKAMYEFLRKIYGAERSIEARETVFDWIKTELK